MQLYVQRQTANSELTTVLGGIQFESQWNDTNTRASDLSEVKSEHVKQMIVL